MTSFSTFSASSRIRTSPCGSSSALPTTPITFTALIRGTPVQLRSEMARSTPPARRSHHRGRVSGKIRPEMHLLRCADSHAHSLVACLPARRRRGIAYCQMHDSYFPQSGITCASPARRAAGRPVQARVSWVEMVSSGRSNGCVEIHWRGGPVSVAAPAPGPLVRRGAGDPGNRARGRPARRAWPRRLPSDFLQCSGRFASRAGG